MKLILNNKKENIELDGIIKRVNNKFFVEVEVIEDANLESIIDNIKGYYNSIGNITLINNKKISIRGSENRPNIKIHEYEAGYVVSSHINEKDILISSMSLYFKELDYFFVEDEYKIGTEKLSEEFSITQKYNNEVLLKNDNISIQYQRTAGIDIDEVGHILFLNPAKLNILFNKPIKLSQVFEEITKVGNCLGFVFGKKMHLIEINVNDFTGIYHELIVPFQKNYDDILLTEFYVVDLNSKQLLKDILKVYYSNERMAAAINMYYEYIYNDLDNIFEFTSLINTLELVLSDKKYESNIKEYARENNKELKLNNEKMNEIFRLLSTRQSKFIKKFYKFDNVILKDKIEYIFYKLFDLEHNDNSGKYITLIVKTRNYYVHGGKKDKTLYGVNMVYTKYLLKKMLYIMIVHTCSNESNSMIDSYRLTIPTVYENLLKHIE